MQSIEDLFSPEKCEKLLSQINAFHKTKPHMANQTQEVRKFDFIGKNRQSARHLTYSSVITGATHRSEAIDKKIALALQRSYKIWILKKTKNEAVILKYENQRAEQAERRRILQLKKLEFIKHHTWATFMKFLLIIQVIYAR